MEWNALAKQYKRTQINNIVLIMHIPFWLMRMTIRKNSYKNTNTEPDYESRYRLEFVSSRSSSDGRKKMWVQKNTGPRNSIKEAFISRLMYSIFPESASKSKLTRKLQSVSRIVTKDDNESALSLYDICMGDGEHPDKLPDKMGEKTKLLQQLVDITCFAIIIGDRDIKPENIVVRFNEKTHEIKGFYAIDREHALTYQIDEIHVGPTGEHGEDRTETNVLSDKTVFREIQTKPKAVMHRLISGVDSKNHPCDEWNTLNRNDFSTGGVYGKTVGSLISLFDENELTKLMNESIDKILSKIPENIDKAAEKVTHNISALKSKEALKIKGAGSNILESLKNKTMERIELCNGYFKEAKQSTKKGTHEVSFVKNLESKQLTKLQNQI